MASKFLFRWFVKAFRSQLVRDAYAGILDREPDATGLAAHAAGLGRSGKLAPVLAEMACSAEAWDHALKAHASDVVAALHAALRNGPADPRDLADWAEQLRDGGDLGGIAAEIAQGPAHWRELARRDGAVLIDAAFDALLDRQPDLDGLRTYTELLRDTGDLTALLADIVRSDEHRDRVLERSAPVDMPAYAPASVDYPALIAAAYQGLLGRDPDPEALAAYKKLLDETGDVMAFLAELDQSQEHRRRLLLRRT